MDYRQQVAAKVEKAFNMKKSVHQFQFFTAFGSCLPLYPALADPALALLLVNGLYALFPREKLLREMGLPSVHYAINTSLINMVGTNPSLYRAVMDHIEELSHNPKEGWPAPCTVTTLRATFQRLAQRPVKICARPWPCSALVTAMAPELSVTDTTLRLQRIRRQGAVPA